MPPHFTLRLYNNIQTKSGPLKLATVGIGSFGGYCEFRFGCRPHGVHSPLIS
jgi:hypothetical protein